jgi:hypothetical protein
MNRLIYLFELDSVCNSRKEVYVAQNALFNEIVIKGNLVIITFNQLTDSLAITSLLQNDKNFESVRELFSMGKIKVSRYGDYRTAAQYILGGLNKCLKDEEKCFYFSGLPVKFNDITVLKDIERALKFSDPNLLSEKAEAYAKQELHDKRELYKFLYRYTVLILAVSQDKLSSNPPNTGEYYKFTDFIKRTCNYYSDNISAPTVFTTKKPRESLIEACTVLKEINTENLQDRSKWLKNLEEYARTNNIENSIVAMCEAVIHLCYNYSVENSINGINIEYGKIETPEFIENFEQRLSRWWSDYLLGVHTLHFHDTDCVEECDENKLVNWKSASRIIKSVQDLPIKKIQRTQNNVWILAVTVGLLFKLISIPVFVAVFVGVEYLLGQFTDFGSTFLTVDKTIYSWLSIAVCGIISTSFSDWVKLPSILESLRTLIHLVVDSCRVLKFIKFKAERGGIIG